MNDSMTASDLGDAADDSISSFSSDVMLRSKLSHIKAKSFAGLYEASEHNSSREESLEEDFAAPAPELGLKDLGLLGIDIVDQTRIDDLQRENEDLTLRNQQLTGVVKREDQVIQKLQHDKLQLTQAEEEFEQNTMILVQDLQEEYNRSVEHFEQEITELSQELKTYRHNAPDPSEALDVQLAREHQETVLMDEELQILEEELEYKRQLSQLESRDQQTDVIRQINEETLHLVEENEARLLRQQVETKNAQIRENSVLLNRGQENIISAYKEADMIQSASSHQTNAVETATNAFLPQPVLSLPTNMAVEEQEQTAVVQNRPQYENLLEQNYVSQQAQSRDRALPVQESNSGMEPETTAQRPIETLKPPQESHTDVSETDMRATDLSLSRLVDTPLRKSVKFVDSPDTAPFMYEREEAKVVAPIMRTNRLSIEDEDRPRSTSQESASRSSSNARPANTPPIQQPSAHIGEMTKQNNHITLRPLDDDNYPDNGDIAEERLGMPLKGKVAPAVQRSVQMSSFPEPIENCALDKEIPTMKEAIRLYRLMQPNQQCKVYERQFGMGEFLGELFGVSPADGVRRLRESAASYNRAIEALQERGESILMSQMHVLLRTHNLLVRYVQAGDLDALRKGEKMPRPEGSGYIISRYPLMQGEKWVLSAVLE